MVGGLPCDGICLRGTTSLAKEFDKGLDVIGRLIE